MESVEISTRLLSSTGRPSATTRLWPTPITTSASCWSIAGRPTKRLPSFKVRCEYKPDHADAHYNLAMSLDRQGKHAEAMASWREALRLEPNNVDTVDEVAWRLATSPDASIRNGRQAIDLARRGRPALPRRRSTTVGHAGCRLCRNRTVLGSGRNGPASHRSRNAARREGDGRGVARADQRLPSESPLSRIARCSRR